ncbi:tetraspanin-11 [Lutzomyia longipalpis]|uniref:tetraspanin-11 n=1 Tax=Lutzomyia longipalpis TaxID=7200 RepID=UPI002483FDDB|nr:tetraspanin-11 [Lutzomyia longipalpis]
MPSRGDLQGHKFVLGASNFIFLTCGVALLAGGFFLFTDNPRILLSRLLGATSEQLADLPQPLFFYIALGLAGAGFIAICAALIGCWAACSGTYCILSVYFLVVLVLLLIEFGICLLITLWPQCMGLDLDETEMVRALQGSYGVPGKEQFTAAMDLAQTLFKCCAISSDINYDTSLWRLQGFGHRELTVPLTCCALQNSRDRNAYLGPKPINLALCQSLQRHEYQSFRHLESCYDKIDLWYRQQYVIFLGAGMIVAIVEFCVLLSIILSCTKYARQRQKRKMSLRQIIRDVDDADTEVGHESISMPDFGSTAPPAPTRLSNRSLARPRVPPKPTNIHRNVENDLQYSTALPDADDGLPDVRKVFVQPPDVFKPKHVTTFRPAAADYHISRSHLV